MSNGHDDTMRRRARAIWGYSMLQQKPFAKAADVDPGLLKDWLGRTRRVATIPDLVNLAAAAGVPRQFAERGFEGLEESEEGLRQEVNSLRIDVDRLLRSLGLSEEAATQIAAEGAPPDPRLSPKTSGAPPIAEDQPEPLSPEEEAGSNGG